MNAMSNMPPSVPSSAAIQMRMWHEITRAEGAIRRVFQRRFDDPQAYTRFCLLNELSWSGGGLTPSNLAAAFQIPTSTMSRLLRDMQCRGWLSTAANSSDQRSTCIHLTNAGEAARDAMVSALAPDLNTLGDATTLHEMTDTKFHARCLRERLMTHLGQERVRPPREMR